MCDNTSSQIAPIRAELVGDDTCTAEGLTAKAYAPVLAMCRRLIAAGHDPGRRLEAWRGDVLALKVRSLADGARLAVKTGPDGTPRFVRAYATASPAATTRSEFIGGAGHGDTSSRA